ncbi:MAG: sulfurtransferase TusA family protein [Paracoccaceae bacterium]|jgi:tRNA 2-thiouridine synthesizing protein A|nr:sulfurtransferase TusA family protein [Paracoccaceae bacterium]
MKYDDNLDATGLLCPLPVLKLRKRLKTLATKQIVRVIADDPAAIIDVPHFCTEQGHKLLKNQKDGKILTFFVQKK